MGIENRNNRFPRIDGDSYHWDDDLPHGIEVTHDNGGDEVSIEFRGRRIEIPRDKVQWLAEVLLQVSDLYRQTWTEEGRDDYNRPGLDARDRR